VVAQVSCPDEECPYKKPEPLTKADKRVRNIIYSNWVCVVLDLIAAGFQIYEHHIGQTITWLSCAVMMGFSAKMQMKTFTMNRRRTRLYEPVCPRCGDTPSIPKELL
jgi:hypothetical protein